MIMVKLCVVVAVSIFYWTEDNDNGKVVYSGSSDMLQHFEGIIPLTGDRISIPQASPDIQPL